MKYPIEKFIDSKDIPKWLDRYGNQPFKALCESGDEHTAVEIRALMALIQPGLCVQDVIDVNGVPHTKEFFCESMKGVIYDLKKRDHTR